MHVKMGVEKKVKMLKTSTKQAAIEIKFNIKIIWKDWWHRV